MNEVVHWPPIDDAAYRFGQSKDTKERNDLARSLREMRQYSRPLARLFWRWNKKTTEQIASVFAEQMMKEGTVR